MSGETKYELSLDEEQWMTVIRALFVYKHSIGALRGVTDTEELRNEERKANKITNMLI